jgi:antitoxin Phd
MLPQKEVIMCKSTIYDARNNFSALVKIAEGGEPVELTRHDKPVAVIISWEDFKCNSIKNRFIEKLNALKVKYADVLADPTFNGLEIPDRKVIDEEYKRRIASIWEE